MIVEALILGFAILLAGTRIARAIAHAAYDGVLVVHPDEPASSSLDRPGFLG